LTLASVKGLPVVLANLPAGMAGTTTCAIAGHSAISLLEQLRMRRFHCAALAAVAACSLVPGASAADLPVKAPVAALIAPALTWTGFYVGGNVGGAWGRFDNAYGPVPVSNPPGFSPENTVTISANGSNTFSPNSPVIGVQAGYNYQIDRAVIGIEGDFGYFGLHGSTNSSSRVPAVGIQTSSTSADAPWLLTLRPRVGVTFGQTLFYATGGLAVASIRLDETNSFEPGRTSAGSDILFVSRTQVGWTAGAGVEHRFSARWSIKGEFLYVDLGKLNATSSSNSPFLGNTTPIFYSHTLASTAEIARVGFNYKLN
jgi:outer membrane immunogenic protein